MADLTSAIFPGLIVEYREGGRLLGIMTGVERDRLLLLQHVVLWPGAPPRALLRMVRDVEARAWREREIDAIVLDVEHGHPMQQALVHLAERRGFRRYHDDDRSCWFVKFKETRSR